jgi:hypothetical protein
MLGKPFVERLLLPRRLRLRFDAEYACKPDSVLVGLSPASGDHLSGARVTAHLGATLLVWTGRPSRERAIERSCFRWGLPERTSPYNSVSSYLTISPLPHIAAYVGGTHEVGGAEVRSTGAPVRPLWGPQRAQHVGAVCFCGTFLQIALTGRYPAPCPVKPGLSSPSVKARPPSVLRAASVARR